MPEPTKPEPSNEPEPTAPQAEPTSTPEPPAVTFTQADLDRVVSERLARERAKFANYDELKSKAEAATAAEQRAADAERKLMLAEVAQSKGLTAAQAKRLAGATRAELEADADDLLSAFGGGKAVEPADEVTDNRPPKEDLRPGAAPAEDVADDVGELADAILSRDY